MSGTLADGKKQDPEELGPERAERYLWDETNCEVSKGGGRVLVNLDDFYAGVPGAVKGEE